MSRYDQPDAPDTDRYDEKPIDAADVPADGEPWMPSSQLMGILFDIDPAEHAMHAIIDALGTLEVELAKVCTLDRIVSLRRMIQGLEKQMSGLADKAAAKHEDFTR